MKFILFRNSLLFVLARIWRNPRYDVYVEMDLARPMFGSKHITVASGDCWASWNKPDEVDIYSHSPEACVMLILFSFKIIELHFYVSYKVQPLLNGGCLD